MTGAYRPRRGSGTILGLPHWVVGAMVTAVVFGVVLAWVVLSLLPDDMVNPPTGPLLDTLPPLAPTDIRSSHAVGVPSDDDTVDVEWEPARDAAPSPGSGQKASGVDGYSIAWSQDPETLPDGHKDLGPVTVGTTSFPLAPGRWWFHIRTVDRAGNWSRTVHLGPFVIMPAQGATPTSLPTPD